MAEQMSKLEALLGAKITEVDKVPEVARVARDSKYAQLLLAVPNKGALRCEYEDNKAAQVKAGIVRGHLERNKQSADYGVSGRGNSVYITKK